MLSKPLVFVLAGWALLALLATLFMVHLGQIKWSGWAFAAADLGLAAATVALSGGFASPLWWGLLVGAIYVALASGAPAALLASACGVLASVGLSTLVATEGLGFTLPGAVQVAAVFVAAAIVGWFAGPARRRAREAEGRQPKVASLAQREEWDRAKALLGMAAQVKATSDLEEVFELGLEMAASMLHQSPAQDKLLVSALLLGSDGQVQVVCARGFADTDRGAILRSDRGALGRALKKGATTVSDNPSQDTGLRNLETLNSCSKAICVPFDAGPNSSGLVLLAHPDAEYLEIENLDLLTEIGRQVGVGLQNAQRYRRLEQEKEQITELQEEARRKMARDLHDGPTQAIAAIAMQLNYARRMMARDPDAAAEELQKVEEMARNTTREMRQMLFTLRPLILESQGLVAALFQLAGKIRDTHGNDVIIEAEADAADQLEMAVQSVLFFIAEEAINNARKHAEAEHIQVRMMFTDSELVLEIEDDGVGFNVGAVDANYEQRGSLGMVTMRERTELVNGSFHVQSTEGEGTLITVSVPFNRGTNP
ncbi:MAG: GAF domain-containing sensor histidine kinase [Anaerolineales bacterium]|jgi:signal transduction histidine kinase